MKCGNCLMDRVEIVECDADGKCPVCDAPKKKKPAMFGMLAVDAEFHMSDPSRPCLKVSTNEYIFIGSTHRYKARSDVVVNVMAPV